MSDSTSSRRPSKGELTARRILDIAEGLFAERGYDGTSLRRIARQAGIQEPGIYNHYRGKEALYAAVVERALEPMLEAMQAVLRSPNPGEAYHALPGVMTDHLASHPEMAALFYQALQSDAESVAGRLIQQWLERLFGQGMTTLETLEHGQFDASDLAIRMIAMFNLTTGYFLSQRVFSKLVGGEQALTDSENIQRQKYLLGEFSAALLNGRREAKP